MKKLVTMLLCLVMALGCVVPAMAEVIPQLPLVEEPVNYTIVANIQGNDVNPKEVPLQMWLEENTNVCFDWTVLTNAETSERISTIMASGDLPDVFINCLGDSDRLTYGQAGALLPIDEYLEYMPNLSAVMEQYPDLRAYLTCPDGHIYSIPQINFYSVWPGNGAYTKSAVNINQKWLDAVGMEIPTTTDELYEVLKAFKTMDPNGNGEADEIPLTFRYSGWNSSVEAFLFGPFGITGWGTKRNLEDGKTFYAISDERYVDAITYMNKLYTEGLIDPEAFTQDDNRYNAKIMEGNVGIYLDWEGTTFANDPEDPTFTLMGPVAGPDGTKMWSNQTSGYNPNYCMVASTVENPELLCQYFDYMLTEEISFQTLWGTFGDYSQNNGDGTYTYYTGSEYPNIFESSIRVMPANFSEELIGRTTVLNKDTGELSDKTGVLKYQVSTLYGPYCTDEYYPSILLDTEANERISVLSTPVSNAIQEKEIAWIMGESDIAAEWESFLAEVNALGLEEMTQIYQDAYDRVMG